MGIKGIFPYFNEALTRRHISSFAGCVAAIDVSGLIYKGMSGPPVPIMQKVIPYIADRMDMLQRYNIQPICVFDGETPPAKKETVAKRNEQRRLSRLPLRNSPESRMLINGIQNAMTVRNIPCIHAPYEADGQIAFFEKNDFVHLVISEDSDFVALGCRKIMFKMNQQGFGDVYDSKYIHRVFKEQTEHFNFDRFVTRCILMGVDYLPNIPGIGPIKIKQLFENTETSNIEEIITAIPEVLNKDLTIPPNYALKFRQAKFALQHQVIYDTCRQERAYLSPIQEPFSKEELILLVGDLKEGEKESNLLLALGNTPIKEAARLRGSFWSTSYNKPVRPPDAEVDVTPEPYVKQPRLTLKCTVCGKIFSSNDYFLTHQRTHTGEKPFPCVICGRPCSSKSKAKQHITTHSANKPYPCYFCEKKFRTYDEVIRHVRTHTGEKRYQCYFCKASYSAYLVHHFRLHTEEKPYRCLLCKKQFKQKSVLMNHKKSHDGVKRHECPYPSCNWAFVRRAEVTDHFHKHTREKLFNCETCGLFVRSKRGLNMHKKRFHSKTVREKAFVCNVCGKSFDENHELTRHIRNHTGEKPFKCRYEGCNMAFKRTDTLQEHMRTHSGEKPFKCRYEGCDMAFNCTGGLQQHMLKHSSEKQFKCTFLGCDKEFKRKTERKEHLDKHYGKRWTCKICRKSLASPQCLSYHMKIHSKTVREKAFVCNVCGTSFYNNAELTRHKIIHTGEKPFKCTFEGCAMAFNRADVLQQHMVRHSKVREKAFICLVCDKSYYTKKELTRHNNRTHTGDKPFKKPFVCEVCETSCYSNSELTIHRRTHTGEKPFKCTEEGCNKAFTTNEHLKGHVLTHSKSVRERPFVCQVCGASFYKNFALTKHKKIHDKDNIS